jgi:hypothetical protein
VDRCVFNGGSLFLEVRFPTVSRSQFTDASIGILGSSGYASNNVVVNGGIWVISDGSGVDIAGNSLSGGIGGIWAHSTKGANVTVQENDLRNCGGIRVTTTPGMPGMTAKITGNVLCNSSTGIDFPDDWGWREIRSNTITGCAGSGFSLAGRALASDLFTQNISSENAVGVQVSYTPAPGTFHCNDVWNNPGGNWVGIADPTGTDDNIAEDPEFCSPVDCDLTLQTGSPCLPDGSPCALQIGARGKGACSLTVTAPSTWGAVKVRYR